MDYKHIKGVLTPKALKSSWDGTFDGKPLDLMNSLKKSSELLIAGVFATALSLTLTAVFGLSTLEMIGAVLTGYIVGKFILTKISALLNKGYEAIKRFNRTPSDIVPLAVPEKVKKGIVRKPTLLSNITKKISKGTKKVLVGALLTYLFTHLISPLIPKLLIALPVITTVLKFAALAVPGLQIAAAAIFAITIIHIVYIRVKAYRIAQKNIAKEQMGSQAADQSENITPEISNSEVSFTGNREKLSALIGLVVSNISLLAFQVTSLIFGLDIVMPIGAILLGSCIVAYTIYSILQVGVYEIILSLTGQSSIKVSAVETRDNSTEDATNTLKPEEENTISRKTQKLNKIMGVAILAIISQHIVKLLFQLPSMQYLAFGLAGLIAVTTILLTIIPSRINKRNLAKFKKSDLCSGIEGYKLYTHESIEPSLDNNDNNVNNPSATEDDISSVRKLLTENPDILLAVLLANPVDEERTPLENSIVKHGFSQLDISVNHLSKETLAKAATQYKTLRDRIIAAPYRSNEFSRDLGLAETSTPIGPTPEKRATLKPGGEKHSETMKESP